MSGEALTRYECPTGSGGMSYHPQGDFVRADEAAKDKARVETRLTVCIELLKLAYDELDDGDLDKPRGVLLQAILDYVAPVGSVNEEDVRWATSKLKGR